MSSSLYSTAQGSSSPLPPPAEGKYLEAGIDPEIVNGDQREIKLKTEDKREKHMTGANTGSGGDPGGDPGRQDIFTVERAMENSNGYNAPNTRLNARSQPRRGRSNANDMSATNPANAMGGPPLNSVAAAAQAKYFDQLSNDGRNMSAVGYMNLDQPDQRAYAQDPMQAQSYQQQPQQLQHQHQLQLQQPPQHQPNFYAFHQSSDTSASAPSSFMTSGRLTNTSSLGKRRVRLGWTKEETDALLEGCKRHGVGNWKKILLDPTFRFNNRTAVDLKDRFRTSFPEEYARLYPNAKTHKVRRRTGAASSNGGGPSAAAPAPGPGPAAPSMPPGAGANPMENNGMGDWPLINELTRVRQRGRSGADNATDASLGGEIGNASEPPLVKINRKERRAFTMDEDARLLEGFRKHGPSWSKIQRDPALQFGERRSTDLRDRFRNAFPEQYAEAGYKGRGANARNAAASALGGAGGISAAGNLTSRGTSVGSSGAGTAANPTAPSANEDSLVSGNFLAQNQGPAGVQPPPNSMYQSFQPMYYGHPPPPHLMYRSGEH